MSEKWDKVADDALDRRLGIVRREVSDRRYWLGFWGFLGVLVICVGLALLA